ncbi:type 4 prepilin-like proteins leader peptide-processing enzyme [Yersinia rohdei]|uniref:Prepilin leader peptidase/N-methyltransferase n=1 Tax=Yersinia rohdei TaxID=29485 RepID=A0ABM5S9A3_YERRO|nr:A24 family peptidase [Yersinia rohdei]AJJ09770.1 type 4 prepilin-like proteins leader peptide-processing enzyme [Yersinia rohdei]EEQ01497.1 Type IV prepilin peptidase [Yersinia rohdei ATCC 43380]
MFELSEFISVLFYVVFGFCIGSFLNVIIYRLPIMLSISRAVSTSKVSYSITEHCLFKSGFNLCFPKSFCPSCFHPLPLKYNIPLFGWFFLRGISQCCGKKINSRYIIVEILTAILTLAVGVTYQDYFIIAASLLLIWSLIVLTFIDLDCYLLPDNITLPLLWVGLLVNINDVFSPLHLSVLGAVVGYIFLWFPYWTFKFFKGIVGMGHGDFKLMAMLGAWFGVTAIPFLVLLSSCFGVVSYIVIYYCLNKRLKYIAFGPYIALAGVIYLFFGEEVNYLF